MKKINKNHKIEFIIVKSQAWSARWNLESEYRPLIKYMNMHFPNYNYEELNEDLLNSLDSRSIGFYFLEIKVKNKIFSNIEFFELLHRNIISKTYSYTDLVTIYEMLCSSDPSVRLLSLNLMDSMNFTYCPFIYYATIYAYNHRAVREKATFNPRKHAHETIYQQYVIMNNMSNINKKTPKHMIECINFIKESSLQKWI